jgi:hypothetical protein
MATYFLSLAGTLMSRRWAIRIKMSIGLHFSRIHAIPRFIRHAS